MRISDKELASFTTTARREDVESPINEGKKERYWRELAIQLYRERGMSVNAILKRVWGINSIDDELSMPQSYFLPESPSQLSKYELNKRMRITRLPMLIDWIKLSDSELAEVEINNESDR